MVAAASSVVFMLAAESGSNLMSPIQLNANFVSMAVSLLNRRGSEEDEGHGRGRDPLYAGR